MSHFTFFLAILALPFLWPVIFSDDQVMPPPEENIETPDMQKPEYGVKAWDIPENLNFAGEEVPVYNPDVREKFDRELLVNTYWHSQTFLFFKRANKHFPVIEEVLEEHGIPEDFKYMVLIESGLENVVSPAGAAGFWQLMQRTGKEYDLEINNQIDERYHLRKSTEVAAKYLNKAYEEFGNWTLAAASYNMGITGVKRVQTSQNIYSYYDMALNPETSRFVYRILAIKEIMENPSEYGFHFTEDQLYQPIETREIKVDGSVDSWVDFAKDHGITYRELRGLNPWIRDNKLSNRAGNTYYVEIPQQSFNDTVSVNIPNDHKFSEVRERRADIMGEEFSNDDLEFETIYHEVKSNQTLSEISAEYNVPTSQIMQWNDIQSQNYIHPGEELKIRKPVE